MAQRSPAHRSLRIGKPGQNGSDGGIGSQANAINNSGLITGDSALSASLRNGAVVSHFSSAGSCFTQALLLLSALLAKAAARSSMAFVAALSDSALLLDIRTADPRVAVKDLIPYMK